MSNNGVVSYALFRSPTSVYEKEKGDSSLQFQQFLPVVLRGHFAIWRGWKLRIHVSEECLTLPYITVLSELTHAGLVELRLPGWAPPHCRAMLWRFKPVFDIPDGIVVMRDLDSIPCIRDRAAVSEFAESDKNLHVVHDNPAHGGIMGGTTAVKALRFRVRTHWHYETDFEKKLESLTEKCWSRHGSDQDFLNEAISPYFVGDTLVHTFDPSNPRRIPEGAEVREFRHSRVTKGIGVCEEPYPWLVKFSTMENRPKEFDVIEEAEKSAFAGKSMPEALGMNVEVEA